MRFNDVYLTHLGYALPTNAVSSRDLEQRLGPVYERLHLQPGQLETITGIHERRYWDPGFGMGAGAVLAARKVLAEAQIDPGNIETLIYTGVCRDNLEPATACCVAHELGISPRAQIYDVSNACLGVLNGILQVANAIELGQISAGLVVSCESARQIVDSTIERMLKMPDMETLKTGLATLTGGSGAVAVLLTHTALASPEAHRLAGGVYHNASRHHGLCRWGPDTGIPASRPHVMQTDAVGVLQHGVTLGRETFDRFRQELEWPDDAPDRVICHQVGSAHQTQILKSLGIAPEKDFTTFEHLGNMGTVSLPLTAAVAHERGVLQTGDRVGLLGIGSGLNCLMLGLRW